MLTVRFRHEAHDELYAHLDWYEEQEPGLGFDFLDTVEEAITEIAEHPNRWPTAPGVPARLGVRRRRLDRFPFEIVYTCWRRCWRAPGPPPRSPM